MLPGDAGVGAQLGLKKKVAYWKTSLLTGTRRQPAGLAWKFAGFPVQCNQTHAAAGLGSVEAAP